MSFYRRQQGLCQIDKFKGTGGREEWLAFRRRLETISVQVHGLGAKSVLCWASLYESHTGAYEDQERTHGVTGLCQDLSLALGYLLEGEPAEIYNNAVDDRMDIDEGEVASVFGNAYVAWQMLEHRYNPRSKPRSVADVRRLQRPP